MRSKSEIYINKKIAIDFYYWWSNQPGTNTKQGFDEYIQTERYKMLCTSITTELDLQKQSEQKEEYEDRYDVEARLKVKWAREREALEQQQPDQKDEQELLEQKQLVYQFAVWLHEQDFTNPDVSIHDWVESFFTRKNS